MYAWSEEYATGEERVDRDHQTLFQMLDDALQDLCHDRFDPELSVKLLKMYARKHFQYEEGCMQRLHCPKHAVNQQHHAAFLAKITEFELRLEAGQGLDTSSEKAALAKEIIDWVALWLKSHILGVDSALGPCLKANA